MVEIPFVINMFNNWTVPRSAFCGVMLIGGSKCFRDLVDKFFVYSKDIKLSHKVSLDFVNNVSSLMSSYFDDLHGLDKRDPAFNIRDAVKVSSPSDERNESCSFGGIISYIYNNLAYKQCKDKCSKKDELISSSGRSFFFNYNCKSLTSLQRFSRSHSGLGDHSTFLKPLLFYLKTISCVRNTEPTLELLKCVVRCVRILEKECVRCGLFGYIDDIVRQFLGEVDKLSFVICQTNASLSLIFSSLHGLATMGGPRGWTQESVKRSLLDWVEGERTMGYESMPHLDATVDRWFDSWVMGAPRKFLSFEEFASDPMRWATGGGAKKSVMSLENREVAGRNKWFWALSHLKNGTDLYSEALKEGIDANVALKEEVKTRCVITTPQSSYLRQCYLLYRLGTPKFLRSTLADPNLVTVLSQSRKDYFICIDSSSFDHSVTKKWIIGIFEKLKKRVDNDLAVLIDEEIDSLKKMNIVFGKEKIKYENGLLSGWRMTSFLGSLLSALVCEHINFKLKIRLEYIVQGDDIIMLCPQKIDQERVLNCCAEFGITTNEKKTTIGRFGEFLKYRYGYGKVQGYAARAVRSIFYANPWLDSLTISKPDEVAGKWWTLLSRLGVSHNGMFTNPQSREWFFSCIVDDIRGWLGSKVSASKLRKCLETPISMGGLGVFETCTVADMKKGSNVMTISILEQDDDLIGDEKFIELFAKSTIAKAGKVKDRVVEISSVIRSFKDDLLGFKAKYNSLVANVSRTVFDSGSNIFRTVLTEIAKCRNYPPIIDLLLRHTFGPCAEVYKPRFLSKANRWFDIARWLTGDSLKGVCPPSLFADTRYDVELVSSLAGVASTMFLNLPNVTANHSYLMSVFAFFRFRQTRCTLHAL